MSNDVKTVLLLCMSPYRATILDEKTVPYTYCYDGPKGKPQKLTGKMTNEAPAKYTIECLKSEGKSLDGVIMICSDKIRTKLGQLIEGDVKSPIGEMTHREYFEGEIRKHDRETNSKEKSEITFEEVKISDFTSDTEVAESVVEAAQKILNIRGREEEERTGIDLYIDFNGGQRYLDFTIINIANLMKTRNVNVKNVITMNFDNKIEVDGENCVKIQNFKTLFRIDNLVSGINEYVNYGRVKNLSEYFKDSEDGEIKAILKEMKEFVDWLALCATTKVLEEKENLKNKLKEYREYMKKGEEGSDKNKEENKGKEETFKILFSFVVEDIEKGYRKMLEGDLPDMIEWCVEKDFIQQAITFYIERMPKYLWESGIFRPTEQEWKEYEEFLRVASILLNNNFTGETGQLRNILSLIGDEDKKRPFKIVWDMNKIREIIQKYDYNANEQLKEFAKRLRNHFCYKDAVKCYEYYEKDKDKDNYIDNVWMTSYLNYSVSMYKKVSSFLTDNMLQRISREKKNVGLNAENIIKSSKIFDNKEARAESVLKEKCKTNWKEKIKNILENYFEIKANRNQVNHAATISLEQKTNGSQDNPPATISLEQKTKESQDNPPATISLYEEIKCRLKDALNELNTPNTVPSSRKKRQVPYFKRNTRNSGAKNTSYIFIPFFFNKRKDFASAIKTLNDSALWKKQKIDEKNDEMIYLFKYVTNKIDKQCFHYTIDEPQIKELGIDCFQTKEPHKYFKKEKEPIRFQIVNIHMYCFSTTVGIIAFRIHFERDEPRWIANALFFLKKVSKEKLKVSNEKLNSSQIGTPTTLIDLSKELTLLDLSKELVKELDPDRIKFFCYATNTERANVLTWLEVGSLDNYKKDLFYLKQCCRESVIYQENDVTEAEENFSLSKGIVWGVSSEAGACLACPKIERGNFIEGTFFDNFNREYLFMFVLLLHQKYVLYMFLTEIGAETYDNKNALKKLEVYRSRLYEFENDFVYSCVTEVPQYQKLYDKTRAVFSLEKMYKDVHDPLVSLEEIRRKTAEEKQNKRDIKVNTALAWLSVLGLFSALNDSFDFAAAFFSWFLGEKGIKVVQGTCIAGIIITFIGALIYVIINLIGSKKNDASETDNFDQ